MRISSLAMMEAILARPNPARLGSAQLGLVSRSSSWRSSLICCQGADSLSRPDNFLSSLLFSSQSTRSFTLSFFSPLIIEPSGPPEQAAMLAAGEGVLFREHVSVGRYRSTRGVNLKLCDCAREDEVLLGEIYCTSRLQRRAVDPGHYHDEAG